MTEQPKKSKYAKVSGAKASAASNYARPGHYLVLIGAVKEIEAGAQNILSVVAELTVLHTFDDGTKGRQFEAGRATEFMVPGEDFAEVFKSDNVAYGPRLKNFTMAALDAEDEAEFTSAEKYPGENIEYVVGEEQPGAGRVLELTAQQVVKKEAKAKNETQLVTATDTYTRCNFKRCVPEAEVAKIVNPAILKRFMPNLAPTATSEAKS
ncbi:MAG: hypothetical protein ACRDLL_16695 [Solirubrobacterales bacterium]